MNFEISNEKLKIVCQKIVDSELDSIKKESDEWGLGEMAELKIINSIDKIVVDRVTSHTRITIYIDLHVNDLSHDYDYEDFMSELNYRIQSYLPKSFVQVNEIIEMD